MQIKLHKILENYVLNVLKIMEQMKVIPKFWSENFSAVYDKHSECP